MRRPERRLLFFCFGRWLFCLVLFSTLTSAIVSAQPTPNRILTALPDAADPTTFSAPPVIGMQNGSPVGGGLARPLSGYSDMRLQRMRPSRRIDDRTPRGALWRSAVLPGWGQIYNRQYVKLPFVYGALGGLIVAVISLDDEYDLYNRAFQYKAYQELVDSGQLQTNPRASYRSSYERIAADVGPVSSRPLEIRRNNLRRGRDLSAIGLGLVYGLAMLDAYVSAHLLDFDVGESLGVEVTPGTDGFRITARVSLSHTGRP